MKQIKEVIHCAEIFGNQIIQYFLEIAGFGKEFRMAVHDEIIKEKIMQKFIDSGYRIIMYRDISNIKNKEIKWRFVLMQFDKEIEYKDIEIRMYTDPRYRHWIRINDINNLS